MPLIDWFLANAEVIIGVSIGVVAAVWGFVNIRRMDRCRHYSIGEDGCCSNCGLKIVDDEQYPMEKKPDDVRMGMIVMYFFSKAEQQEFGRQCAPAIVTFKSVLFPNMHVFLDGPYHSVTLYHSNVLHRSEVGENEHGRGFWDFIDENYTPVIESLTVNS